jgi:hypothetical protein
MEMEMEMMRKQKADSLQCEEQQAKRPSKRKAAHSLRDGGGEGEKYSPSRERDRDRGATVKLCGDSPAFFPMILLRPALALSISINF